MRISDWSSDVCSSDLVHDGIMFVPTAGARVQAIDAKTGEFIWDYRYRLPSGEWPSPLPNRGIALFADMVFLATPDAAIVAIDARTGKERWRAQDGDPSEGFQQIGRASCRERVGQYVVISGVAVSLKKKHIDKNDEYKQSNK